MGICRSLIFTVHMSGFKRISYSIRWEERGVRTWGNCTHKGMAQLWLPLQRQDAQLWLKNTKKIWTLSPIREGKFNSNWWKPGNQKTRCVRIQGSGGPSTNFCLSLLTVTTSHTLRNIWATVMTNTEYNSHKTDLTISNLCFCRMSANLTPPRSTSSHDPIYSNTLSHGSGQDKKLIHRNT